MLKWKFPTHPPFKSFISLEDWRKNRPAFFFTSKAELHFPKHATAGLQEQYDHFLKGEIQYFNAGYGPKGWDEQWHIHPLTRYQYDPAQHWTTIENFSQQAGDIKYVWEKSRFTFLLMLIRYDYHHDVDCGELAFANIENWIRHNPINQGPNYVCSQETSIRILHWTYALYYYADHPALSAERFASILHSIYWQLRHVRNNIQFSRTCVRNNHALTETLMLYAGGLIFPFFPEGVQWKNLGQKWFETEIMFQVAEDGTFLQYSHNYQRVLMQLLTWYSALTYRHGNTTSDAVLERSRAVVNYIHCTMNTEDGYLPNYGANDGALFFKLNDNTFRDYRPQLNALHYANEGRLLFKDNEEDCNWFFPQEIHAYKVSDGKITPTLNSFPNGGIYIIRDEQSLAFIKCADLIHRPGQADNLHLDLWHLGRNIMRDQGTYQYNTSGPYRDYFPGSTAHNTITLGEHDQMQRGPRFIWLNWTKWIHSELHENEQSYFFSGSIRSFHQIHPAVIHHRTVEKRKDKAEWLIVDEISPAVRWPMKQWWHPVPDFFDTYTLSAVDQDGQPLILNQAPGYYSSSYGTYDPVDDYFFETQGRIIRTTIAYISPAEHAA